MGLQQVKPYVLHLFFSNKYTYAQIIQNPKGSVVAAASTIEKALRTQVPSTSDRQARPALCSFAQSRDYSCLHVSETGYSSQQKGFCMQVVLVSLHVTRA